MECDSCLVVTALDRRDLSLKYRRHITQLVFDLVCDNEL